MGGRWRLLRRLGKGGQAEVWLAEDRQLGERVAIKVFGVPPTPEASERWRREVRAGRALHHPGIVRIHDLVEHEGGFFAVMEPVLGGTLADRIEQEGPLPVGEVVRVAEALLEVLAYLHGRGIVHRDLKPSNVLFDPEGTVRLGDLGLARRIEGEVTLTRTAAVVGTPAYMAPEQLAGGEASPSWDLYALGVTLYEALTGRRPFAGDSAFAVADGHLHRRVTPVRELRRDCPRWLARFVERLLEKRPEDRWPSAAAALAALRRRRVAASPRVRRRAAAGALAVLAAAAAGYAGWWAWRAPRAAVRVQVEPNAVAGLDAGGRAAWRYRTAARLPTAIPADLLPLPGREVAVIDHLGRKGAKTPVLAVVDARGRELYREPFQGSGQWPFPVRSWQVSDAVAGDLDGDGLEELVTLVTSEIWYPAEVFLLEHDAGARLMNRCILANSGVLHRVLLTDVNGDGVRDVVVSGLNNPLGFQVIAAAVDPRSGSSMWALSPDLATDQGTYGISVLDRLLFYTVIADRSRRRAAAFVETVEPAGFLLRAGRGTVRLDRWGNPEGSPLAGGGGERRAAFWRDLVVLCGQLREDPGSWRELWQGFIGAHADVLTEPGAEIAAALMAARALADAARHREGAALLGGAAARHPDWGDLWLRRGEYLILGGDRVEGRASLVRSASATASGRNAYDAYLLLALDAALAVDPAGLAEAIEVMRRGVGVAKLQPQDESLRALLLFSEGDWSDLLLRGIEDRPEYPWLPWLRLWAEVAGGRRDAGSALEEVRRRLPESDAPEAGRLLEAELLRRLGDTPGALQAARDTLERLSVMGRRSLEAFAWVPLAHWETAEALLASGRQKEATPHLREAARLAPRTWYGRGAARRLAGG